MVCQNLIRGFNRREDSEKLFHQLKQIKGFSLRGLLSVSFQPKRLCCRKAPGLNVGALCVNGNTIRGKGVKVRVDLELLRSLHPLHYVLHFPSDRANAAVGGEMCIPAEQR